MTVKELIEQLQKQNQDAEVLLYGTFHDSCADIIDIAQGTDDLDHHVLINYFD